ncbi:MAG: hypothetical protein KGL39_46485 [Patescibacteria group bacterium]|nr:hypothetical protein [Patescibacteria group bacterium]
MGDRWPAGDQLGHGHRLCAQRARWRVTERRIIIGRGAEPPRKRIGGLAPIEPFMYDEIEKIRRGKLTATLITGALRPPRPDQLKPLRQVVRVLDGDGNETGEMIVSTLQAPITVRTVTPIIDLTILEDVILGDRVRRLALSDEHAKQCGRTSALELRDQWLAKHPRIPLVRVVTFAYHDQRDPAYYVARGNGYTTAPAQSIDREVQAVTGDALAWISSNTRETQQQKMRRVKSAGVKLRQAESIEDARAICEGLLSEITDGELEEAA